jgi:hypothetical protein
LAVRDGLDESKPFVKGQMAMPKQQPQNKE